MRYRLRIQQSVLHGQEHAVAGAEDAHRLAQWHSEPLVLVVPLIHGWELGTCERLGDGAAAVQ